MSEPTRNFPEDATATVTIYHPDGIKTVTRCFPDQSPSLEHLQEAVGGYIEPVDAYLPEGTRAYANEEGLLLGLPHNPEGTKAVGWPYPIVGPIVVCEGFDPEEGE